MLKRNGLFIIIRKMLQFFNFVLYKILRRTRTFFELCYHLWCISNERCQRVVELAITNVSKCCNKHEFVNSKLPLQVKSSGVHTDVA